MKFEKENNAAMSSEEQTLLTGCFSVMLDKDGRDRTSGRGRLKKKSKDKQNLALDL